MLNTRTAALALFLATTALGCIATRDARAQGADPRQVLGMLISAFQNCGPPDAYQWLGPQLYQTVYMQTNGSGCYGAIRQAGPITSMQIMSQQQFPAGPIYQIRVMHTGAVADWFIGISQFTGRVEYLNYQAAQQGTPAPDIRTGPAPDGGPSPAPGPDADSDDGCSLYPSMCMR